LPANVTDLEKAPLGRRGRSARQLQPRGKPGKVEARRTVPRQPRPLAAENNSNDDWYQMSDYGPHNPHPLSTMRTELVWEGKYDEFGNRREVNAAGLAMPIQKIETIDEPKSRALAQGSLFDEKYAHVDDFRNRLIWGENKLVMMSLLEEFRETIGLIYIDPPFDVGADFCQEIEIGQKKNRLPIKKINPF
jgi:hypothetical protein